MKNIKAIFALTLVSSFLSSAAFAAQDTNAEASATEFGKSLQEINDEFPRYYKPYYGSISLERVKEKTGFDSTYQVVNGSGKYLESQSFDKTINWWKIGGEYATHGSVFEGYYAFGSGDGDYTYEQLPTYQCDGVCKTTSLDAKGYGASAAYNISPYVLNDSAMFELYVKVGVDVQSTDVGSFNKSNRDRSFSFDSSSKYAGIFVTTTFDEKFHVIGGVNYIIKKIDMDYSSNEKIGSGQFAFVVNETGSISADIKGFEYFGGIAYDATENLRLTFSYSKFSAGSVDASGDTQQNLSNNVAQNDTKVSNVDSSKINLGVSWTF